MTEQRIIKKYPNRRLYDTAISSYITLEDVKELVLACVDFKVIDARSQEDITHNTLLQIINEQEDSGSPILTNQFMQQLIRNYGNSIQGIMSTFLEQSMQLIVEQREELNKQLNTLMDPAPLSMINELTKQNLNLWQKLQESFIISTAFAPQLTATKERATETEVE